MPAPDDAAATLVCGRCGGPVCVGGRTTLPLSCLDPECRHAHRHEKTPPPRIRLTRRDTDPQEGPIHATG